MIKAFTIFYGMPPNITFTALSSKEVIRSSFNIFLFIKNRANFVDNGGFTVIDHNQLVNSFLVTCKISLASLSSLSKISQSSFGSFLRSYAYKDEI